MLRSLRRHVHIIRTIAEMRAVRSQYAKSGVKVGFVPTMGALHDGHIQLMKNARKNGCDRIVCSIFVNPTQFGAGEDFEKYPRPFENDVKKLTENQIDAVFAPEWTEVYPPPAIGEVVSVRGGSEPLDAGTWVTAPSVDATTEGLKRPGHFRGVATVVTKLFNIVQPDEAFFGQKDGIQSILVTKIARDLNMHTKVTICPTVRENDGLAMSSRNVYLTPSQRHAAPLIHQSLRSMQGIWTAAHTLQRRTCTVTELRKHVVDFLSVNKVDLTWPPQYVSFAHLKSGLELDDEATVTEALVSIAVVAGKTRLLDNVILNTNSNEANAVAM